MLPTEISLADCVLSLCGTTLNPFKTVSGLGFFNQTSWHLYRCTLGFHGVHIVCWHGCRYQFPAVILSYRFPTFSLLSLPSNPPLSPTNTQVPFQLSLGPITTITAGLGMLPRALKGSKYTPVRRLYISLVFVLSSARSLREFRFFGTDSTEVVTRWWFWSSAVGKRSVTSSADCDELPATCG